MATLPLLVRVRIRRRKAARDSVGNGTPVLPPARVRVNGSKSHSLPVPPCACHRRLVIDPYPLGEPTPQRSGHSPVACIGSRGGGRPCSSHRVALAAVTLARGLDRFLEVAEPLLRLADELLGEPPGFLLSAADETAGRALDLADRGLRRTLQLVLVHRLPFVRFVRTTLRPRVPPADRQRRAAARRCAMLRRAARGCRCPRAGARPRPGCRSAWTPAPGCARAPAGPRERAVAARTRFRPESRCRGVRRRER